MVKIALTAYLLIAVGLGLWGGLDCWGGLAGALGGGFIGLLVGLALFMSGTIFLALLGPKGKK